MSDDNRGKLYELIAVEGDLSNRRKIIFHDTLKAFTDKQTLFHGSIKTLSLFTDSQIDDLPPEYIQMTDTVDNQLDFYMQAEIPYLDATAQKDRTNQEARSDVIVDGDTIAYDLPATFLLGLEQKLAGIRELYAKIPTLQVGIEWVPSLDKGRSVYDMVHPIVTFKTAKQFKHQILVGPTDKHPAQVEKWEEQVPVGKYSTSKWCSCLTSERKAELLTNIDKLIVAVKQARQRANSVPVVPVTVGKSLFDYIHGK